ncbi:MAG: hypothetical protein ACSHXI_16475 [Hoeflea sp.]|uniref:hypothetical protein n=1 Tax=Hoeflea sp. TaxID=1940281 RepID=UPI003EF2EA48
MSSTNRAPSEWKPKRQRLAFENVLLIVLCIGTGFMAFLAMLGLIPETGFSAYAKSAVIAIIAAVVSYAINRFAIEKGAPLAATGYVLAAVISVVSILFVGAGLFASTYAGMTIDSVNELQLQHHGQALSRHISAQNAKFTQATRTLPVIQSISADLNQKVACELATSCISGRGDGGRGSVTRAMEALAGRADTIAAQLFAGESKRQKLVGRLNDQLAAYQTVLGNSEWSIEVRRQKLTSIDADIHQTLSEIGEAVPTSLLSAYARELQIGVSIDDRAEATSRLNSILGDHGRALASVIASIDATEIERPLFPAQAGVSSTFGQIAYFMPIAAITAVVELVLPLALWVYTFVQAVWDKEQRSPRTQQAAQPSKDRPSEAKSDQSKRRNHPRHSNRNAQKANGFDRQRASELDDGSAH